MAVVTNIDADHMETYGHDFGRLKQAFVDFLHRMPFYGRAICASTALRSAKSCPRSHVWSRPMALPKMPRCAPSMCAPRLARCALPSSVSWGEHVYPDMDVVLSLPGEHNVLNALSATTGGDGNLDSPISALQRALVSSRRGPLPKCVDLLASTGGTQPSSMTATTVELAGLSWLAPCAFLVSDTVLAFQPHL